MRGARTAAVLMAGLVGSAVLAPGLAFAQDTASDPTPSSCARQGDSYDADTQSCVSPQALAAAARAKAQEAVAEAKAEAAARAAAARESAEEAAAAAREQAASTTTPTTPTTAPTSASATPADTTTGTTATDPTAAAGDTAAATTASAITPEQAAAAVRDLVGADLPKGLPIDQALKDLPTGNLNLGDGVTVPDLPTTGSFSSPRDACLYLASKVTVDAADADAIGAQFASFCGSLPGSFDPSTGYGSLPDLAAVLAKLCHGLKHSHHHDWVRDDVDCPEISYDEAQAILARDPSDPYHLDGDHDGIACEADAKDYETVVAHYDGYPQGGVATGDSEPGTGPGAAVALAGLALAAVAGATAARREDGADEDELVTVGEG